jgi:predicted ATP-binding protein involved in virulence
MTEGAAVDNKPLRIDSVRLRNYRGFVELGAEFHPGLTVIVARNGLGKTAVLDAVAVALGPFVGAFDGRNRKGFAPADVRQVRNPNSILAEMEPMYPLTLEASGVVDSQAVAWTRRLESARSHTTYADATALTQFARNLQSRIRDNAGGGVAAPPILPLVACYGSGRLWDQLRLTQGKRAEAKTSREAGYTDCLSSSSRYKSFSDWFERLCRAEYELRDNASKLAAIRDQLGGIREAVDHVLAPSGWHTIAFKSSEAGIVASHPEHGSLPVEWLSDGIRNLIALTGDIAHRAVRLNSHLGGRAVRETPGIVLIDEVDMHLHPEWQQVVVGALHEAFPRIQFILTTHSPQVVSTVHRESVRVPHLSGETWCFVAPEFQTRGVESTDVLAEIMGVNPVPQVEEAQLLGEYRALIEAGESDGPAASELRSLLVGHFGPAHPVILDCDRLARFQSFRRRAPRSQGS